MNPIDIVVAAAGVAIVVFSIVYTIIKKRRRKAKGEAGCGCSGCMYADDCASAKADRQCKKP